jgi:hypothetical protein
MGRVAPRFDPSNVARETSAIRPKYLCSYV